MRDKIEKSINRFAAKMKELLGDNVAEKGDWSETGDITHLTKHLRERVEFFADQAFDLDSDESFEQMLEDAAHIANIAMILAETFE